MSRAAHPADSGHGVLHGNDGRRVVERKDNAETQSTTRHAETAAYVRHSVRGGPPTVVENGRAVK